MKTILILAGLLVTMLSTAQDFIKPYSRNPGYWQYKGNPTLLMGGTKNDNLFQSDGLNTHLDSLKKAGGNYIRNTMSDRDEGDLRAFLRNSQGMYDLERWNDAYWEKFENLLKLTSERDIIVQIEIWDRFDHSREYWLGDPYNPGNNINYSYAESDLDSVYPEHPGRNKQPFFYTVPALDNNENVLQYQRAFVDKLLSISLDYGNVLYCIDNETSGEEEWAVYWRDFVMERAGEREIYITEMWDNWDVKSDRHKRTIDHPERYGFIDISQNSHRVGHENWENSQYVLDYLTDNRRPVNSTKIYGADVSPWAGQGKNSRHAIQTFYRNLVGGFASSRFHRPPHGMGLSAQSVICMQTVRNIEKVMKFWDLVPRMDLLVGNEDGEAYIAAREGVSYMVFFPGMNQVHLDLRNYQRTFRVIWIDVATGYWRNSKEIKGGRVIPLGSRNNQGSIALLKVL